MKGMMNMMGCRDVMERLWEFLDGELPEQDREALERHLEACGRCYPAYDFQKSYLEYTRRLATRVGAPPEVRRQLFERLLATEAAGQTDPDS